MHEFWTTIVKFQRKNVWIENSKTSINSFFWDAFEILLPAIRSKLEDQSRRYIITGHSLGGAMASILAIYMKVNGVSIMLLSTDQSECLLNKRV